MAEYPEKNKDLNVRTLIMKGLKEEVMVLGNNLDEGQNWLRERDRFNKVSCFECEKVSRVDPRNQSSLSRVEKYER